MENKMNTKKLFVSLLMLVGVLVFVASVSAAPLATLTNVEVNGLSVTAAGPNPAVIAGDTVNVRVDFTALANTSSVTVKATFEGNKADTEAQTSSFDVESGQTYERVLQVDVPSDLKDTLSDTVTLDIRVKGSDGFITTTSYTLRVQRDSYNADILSVSVPQTAKAGQSMPVDVVVQNTGYNNLDNLFVTVKIPALGVESTSFLGDIVAVECDKSLTSVKNYGVDVNRKCNEDNVDTVSGRVFVQIPQDAKSGAYALQVSTQNEDSSSSKTVQVVVDNAFSNGNFIVSGNQLLIVNPTNEVVVYRLIPESTGSMPVSISESLVAVPAGSSKSVTVTASPTADSAPVYTVDVFSADGQLVEKVNFSSATTATSGKNGSSPIVVLTVILAIIFVILLVVLMVLIGKKPEKEEFGESYY